MPCMLFACILWWDDFITTFATFTAERFVRALTAITIVHFACCVSETDPFLFSIFPIDALHSVIHNVSYI